MRRKARSQEAKPISPHLAVFTAGLFLVYAKAVDLYPDHVKATMRVADHIHLREIYNHVSISNRVQIHTSIDTPAYFERWSQINTTDGRICVTGTLGWRLPFDNTAYVTSRTGCGRSGGEAFLSYAAQEEVYRLQR